MEARPGAGDSQFAGARGAASACLELTAITSLCLWRNDFCVTPLFYDFAVMQTLQIKRGISGAIQAQWRISHHEIALSVGQFCCPILGQSKWPLTLGNKYAWQEFIVHNDND